MNEFLKSNKIYIAIIALGIILFLIPSFKGVNIASGNQEKRFKEVIENVSGVGEVEIMTNTTNDGKIKGVIIVARGAEDLQVKKQIYDAAVVAFDVLPNKVQVFSQKKEVSK